MINLNSNWVIDILYPELNIFCCGEILSWGFLPLSTVTSISISPNYDDKLSQVAIILLSCKCTKNFSFNLMEDTISIDFAIFKAIKFLFFIILTSIPLFCQSLVKFVSNEFQFPRQQKQIFSVISKFYQKDRWLL